MPPRIANAASWSSLERREREREDRDDNRESHDADAHGSKGPHARLRCGRLDDFRRGMRLRRHY